MQKADPHPEYPPEEGRYLRGNDFSPAAVVIILAHEEEKIPPEIEDLVRTGAEAGAALSGTVQTPNIGIEKIICNVIANPNIRYAILSGPESEGHRTGDAFKSLFRNGVDERKRIIGTDAKHPLLYNLPMEFIERFCTQVTLVDIQFKGTPETIRKAVRSCYQEEPVEFMGYELYDPGAYSETPLSGKITDRVTRPWAEPENDAEKEAVRKMQEMVEKLRKRKKSE
ncbi:MAG TPA: tetrahydromethanopterin S-methyltransferase subunit A [Spirochaetota bacterium]|nr:tetrahydromethanopterin S-methyltransferase subunit A [Spirochaetota bacterium]